MHPKLSSDDTAAGLSDENMLKNCDLKLVPGRIADGFYLRTVTWNWFHVRITLELYKKKLDLKLIQDRITPSFY